jgi:hypothetical protein
VIWKNQTNSVAGGKAGQEGGKPVNVKTKEGLCYARGNSLGTYFMSQRGGGDQKQRVGPWVTGKKDGKGLVVVLERNLGVPILHRMRSWFTTNQPQWVLWVQRRWASSKEQKRSQSSGRTSGHVICIKLKHPYGAEWLWLGWHFNKKQQTCILHY